MNVLPTQGIDTRVLRIDAHHHLWHFNDAEFSWIDDSMAILRRDFLVAELRRQLEATGIDATVAVQARESIEETQWLLETARLSSFICGVVGWAPLAADDLSEILDGFHASSKLVGFREVLQGKPDGYLGQAAFNRGIEELGRRGLTYDVLLYERQLPEATHFVDRHPKQQFVLDHAAKPKISKRELEPWRRNLGALAQRPNVYCKISGLVTEADWETWTPESLVPYLDACVEAFGVDRLIAGSDWPVCLLASSYQGWWEVLAHFFASFSEGEKVKIFGGNAIKFYGLTSAEARCIGTS